MGGGRRSAHRSGPAQPGEGRRREKKDVAITTADEAGAATAGRPPTKIKNNFNIAKNSLKLLFEKDGKAQLQFSYDATRAGEGEIFWGCSDDTRPNASPEEIADHGLDIQRTESEPPDIFKFRKGVGQIYTGYCDSRNIGRWAHDDEVFDLAVRLRGIVDNQEQSQTTFCKVNRPGTEIQAFLQKLTYQGYVIQQFENVFGLSSGADASSDADADKCVVCYTKRRDCILLPCRHCCLCYECAIDLTSKGSVELRYGEVTTGADPKCPMCRANIDEVFHVDSLNKDDHKSSKHTHVKSGKKGKKRADSNARTPSTETPSDLPYGGDLQAAMKAQDRDAIRVLMSARDESGSAAGAGANAPAAQPKLDLPYGGDLQAAMKAQDRDAIRVLMSARDSNG